MSHQLGYLSASAVLSIPLDEDVLETYARLQDANKLVFDLRAVHAVGTVGASLLLFALSKHVCLRFGSAKLASKHMAEGACAGMLVQFTSCHHTISKQVRRV